METLKLESTLRAGMGKGPSRRLRSTGRIPAVLYGREMEPIALELEESAIRAVLMQHPESAVIDLSVEGGEKDEPVNVIIRDVQRHPATGRILHVDFQKIKFGEKIRVEVQVELSGKPKGVKDQGGILEHRTRMVQVMALPRKIPEALELDVTELMIGDALKMADLMEKYPEIDFLDDPEADIAGVRPPVIEVEPVAEEAAVEEGEEEPELVAKEKKEEEEPEEKPEESS